MQQDSASLKTVLRYVSTSIPCCLLPQSISVTHCSEEEMEELKEEELKRLKIELDVYILPCALHLLAAPCHLGLSVARLARIQCYTEYSGRTG